MADLIKELKKKIGAQPIDFLLNLPVELKKDLREFLDNAIAEEERHLHFEAGIEKFLSEAAEMLLGISVLLDEGESGFYTLRGCFFRFRELKNVAIKFGFEDVCSLSQQLERLFDCEVRDEIPPTFEVISLERESTKALLVSLSNRDTGQVGKIPNLEKLLERFNLLLGF